MMIKNKIIYIIILFNSVFLFSNEVEVYYSNTFLQSEKCFRDVSKVEWDSILGTYVLESCENSRFKIVINKKENCFFNNNSINNIEIIWRNL